MSSNNYADVTALFPGKARRRFKDVELPVAGTTVRIQSLLAGEVTRFQSALVSRRSRKIIQGRLEDSPARLIVLCVVDANGTRILNDTHIQKIVEEWDNADVSVLSTECTRHCGMDQDEFEDLAKNSGRIPFDNETSASPEAAIG